MDEFGRFFTKNAVFGKIGKPEIIKKTGQW